MTKTVRHRETSSDASDSMSESSVGAFTPQTDSTIAFSFVTADENPSRIQERSENDAPAADLPIPSIERNSDSAPDDNYTTTTPLPSTSPPSPNTSDNSNGKGKGKAVLRDGDGTESIDTRLGHMRISSPESRLGMSDMAAAIEVVASSSGTQAALLEPRYVGTEDSSSNARRRRSNSRVNTTPHDVRDEDPPQDRFHDPAFQRAFRDAKGLMSNLAGVLGSSALHIDPDSTMQRLYRETGDLAHFQCPPSRTVGFVGDSGVGKSSLLNSMLDFHGLARTSNSGAACTCVVTEYHYHDSDNFVIETALFSLDEIMDQITDLLQSYRQCHLHSMDMENDQKRDFEEKAKMAEDTFRAMFRGRLHSEEFLAGDPEDSVLETLRSWAQDMRPSSTGGREVRATLGGCAALLMQLTSEQTSAQEPAVWPYVQKIKVFLKAHILSKGLVLVDLPGLRDLNSARRNVTERYLLQCDEIFAICYIGRATTDAGVMSVFELARQARLSNVGIICTKSDDIQAEEAKKDWKGRKAQDIQRFIDDVDRDRLHLESLEAQLPDYSDADDMSEGEKERELALSRSARKVKKRMDDHRFELKRYLVSTRNTTVTQKLNDLYQNRVPGSGLRVFCVSNTDYWEHRNMPKEEALPLLQLSGIIAIRKHCISMVAKSQLRIATKYIQDSIPALLGDIALWVESGAGSVSAERKLAVRETLDLLEARIRRNLTGSSSQIYDIARSFKKEFKTELYDRRRVYGWSQAASNAASEWSTWHPSSYKAFCREYGTHTTDIAGTHNWNEEAIETMIEDLATPWEGLRATLQSLHRSMVVAIEDLMEWAIEYLVTELQEFSDPIATLSQTLRSRQNLLVADVEDVCENFETGLSTLRTDALSGIRSSLIGQAMENSYRACNFECGTGSDRRRKRIINDKLSSQSIFEELMKQFRSRFNVLAIDLQRHIEEKVEEHLNIVRGTLDIIRSENAATEGEQDPAFRGRVQTGIRTAQDNIREVQTIVAAILEETSG